MCTAIRYAPDGHYFGRNLDLEFSYGESVAITPRNFPFRFRMAHTPAAHYAMIGAAHMENDYPLYYDAVNEAGLAMAGLNFPEFSVYQAPRPLRDNLAPFELIPWVLSRCSDLEQAERCLERVNLVDLPFSSHLPNTPLHWMISDASGSLVAEPMESGLRVIRNPAGVLTNSPSFDWHMTNLRSFLSLSSDVPQNRFSAELELSPYSRGMGAAGLPGDWSSPSRFVRAAFLLHNSQSGPSELSHVTQFFHLLSAVAMPRGCIRLEDGRYEHTLYSCCCDCRKGIYYYTTYENSTITAVDMHAVDLNSRHLTCSPLL